MRRQGRGGGGAYSYHADGDDQERPALETEQPYGDSVKHSPTRAHQHAQGTSHVRVQRRPGLLHSRTEVRQQRPSTTDRQDESCKYHKNSRSLLKVVRCEEEDYEKGRIYPVTGRSGPGEIVDGIAVQKPGSIGALGCPMHAT